MLDKDVMEQRNRVSNLADPGGCELWELVDGRLAKGGQEPHASNARVEHGSGDTSN